MVNYYDLLGVTREATEQDIRRAFKKAALQLHPDKNPDGETMFKKVAEAYNILVHRRSRQEYDSALERSSPTEASYTTPDSAQDTPRWKNSKFYEEVQRRRSESEAQQRRQAREFAAQNINFADWYKGKVEAQQSATDDAKRKLGEILREQQDTDRREAAERAAAAEKEEAHRREFEKRKMEQQQENERHKERIVHQKRAQEQVIQKQKEAEWMRDKEEREKEAEKSLKELAANRKHLQREKERLAAEVKHIPELDPAVKRANAEKRNVEMERTLKDAEDNLNATRRRAEDLQREREERDRLQRLNDEKEKEHTARMNRELQKNEAQWREEQERQHKHKQVQASEIAKMNRQMMRDAQNARLQHEADLRAMRAETEKMERDMLAKLEAVRKAKREGRFVDLSQLTLDGELKSLEPVIMQDCHDESAVRVGSSRSLAATHGSGKGLTHTVCDDSDDDMPLLRTYARASVPQSSTTSVGSGSSSPTPSPPELPREDQTSKQKKEDDCCCSCHKSSPTSLSSSSLARAAYHLQTDLLDTESLPSAQHSPSHGRRSTRSTPSPSNASTREAGTQSYPLGSAFS